MNPINGIGGAFLFSNDATRLAQWYEDNLGFKFDGSAEYGAFYQMFYGLDPSDPQRKLDTTFSIMKATVPLPKRKIDSEPDNMYGDQSFMVNFRVTDLDEFLKDLAAKGIEPIKRQDESYGKFAWIRDLDGNRVELYQPLIPPAAS